MKIAFVTDIPILQTGGVEVIVRELILGLAKDHEIFLVSPDSVLLMRESTVGKSLVGFSHLPSDPSLQEAHKELFNELKCHNTEICHFHLGGTFGLNSGSLRDALIPRIRATGIRCYSSNHQVVSPFDINQLHRPLLKRLASFVKRTPGKIRCLRSVEVEFLDSEHDARLSRIWFPFQSKKFEKIYHSCLSDQPPEAELPHSKVILNLATICYRKGQHLLAEAFTKIAPVFPEWRLELVGKTAEEGCLEHIRRTAMAAGIASQIKIAGPTDDPKTAILGSEVYVQPSLLEALGLSLQEAMFYGRPCIGSRVGGIPEIIDDGRTGLLVEPNDVDALATALSKVMRDRELREQYGGAAAGSIPAKGMTRAAMVAAYASVYQKV